jgi:hypothetical protein
MVRGKEEVPCWGDFSSKLAEPFFLKRFKRNKSMFFVKKGIKELKIKGLCK